MRLNWKCHFLQWIRKGSFPKESLRLTCLHACQNMCQNEFRGLSVKLANFSPLRHQSSGLESIAYPRETEQGGIFSLRSLASGLTRSSRTKRLLFDEACILVTCCEVTGCLIEGRLTFLIYLDTYGQYLQTTLRSSPGGGGCSSIPSIALPLWLQIS